MKRIAKLLILIGGVMTIAYILNGVTQDDSETTVSRATYTNVSHEELNEMLLDKDFLMVNVHVPYEGNLPKTDFSIAYNKISQNFDAFPEDKDAKIVVYCRTGSMSKIAASELISSGYTNVINLEDGFHGWADAGFPIEDYIIE